jgi:hypothetical protein
MRIPLRSVSICHIWKFEEKDKYELGTACRVAITNNTEINKLNIALNLAKR